MMDGWGQVIFCRVLAVEARREAARYPKMNALADTAGKTADKIKSAVLRAEEMQLTRKQFSLVQDAVFSE